MNITQHKINPDGNVFDTDLATHRRFGLIIFILLFGFGGVWSATSPVDGAAVASGMVTSRSYSKVVQHLEGGIIQEIFVEDGARVELGDPILEIDSTNASAAFNSGFIYLEFHQDYENGEKWFSEAIKRLPYYHHAFFNRGLCRESMDDLEGALSDYNEALRLEPTFSAAAIAKGRVLDHK